MFRVDCLCCVFRVYEVESLGACGFYHAVSEAGFRVEGVEFRV